MSLHEHFLHYWSIVPVIHRLPVDSKFKGQVIEIRWFLCCQPEYSCFWKSRQVFDKMKCLADVLTHWGWVMHMCVSKLTIIDSDNGLSPVYQTIIWTNAGTLSIWIWGTNLSEILCKTLTFLFNKMHLKMLSVKLWQFCLGLNVLQLLLGCCDIVPKGHFTNMD